jgi:phosphate-selective porin
MRSLVVAAMFVLVMVSMASSVVAADGAAGNRNKRIEELEKTVTGLVGEIEALKGESGHGDEWWTKFTLGGYGEMHANFGESKSADKFDLHRLVLYLGYDFNDWIEFHSEFEIEHAFVSDGDGELSVEQAIVDLHLNDAFNVRVGRVLTPLGIINSKHEPPTFNGVERPSFAKYVIPSTWSSDGAGVFGSLCSSLSYQAYVVGGLDGSMFDAENGIRKGRIKEQPSLHDPAVTGRLDLHPLAPGSDQRLRLGVSGYAGGIDNGNDGANPGTKGDIQIYSTDFEYSVCRFDARGVIAHTTVDEAASIGNGAGSEMFGWYLEGGYHVMPEAWKKGKMAKSDAVVFVRYDEFDTQYRRSAGVVDNPAATRGEWTFGAGLYLTPQIVVKADYQFAEDRASKNLNDKFNLGVGWEF